MRLGTVTDSKDVWEDARSTLVTSKEGKDECSQHLEPKKFLEMII